VTLRFDPCGLGSKPFVLVFVDGRRRGIAEVA
jgi:hypothetical protein